MMMDVETDSNWMVDDNEVEKRLSCGQKAHARFGSARNRTGGLSLIRLLRTATCEANAITNFATNPGSNLPLIAMPIIRKLKDGDEVK
jgi:hypothetical protein